jgi:diguanylate cyclase
MRSSGQFRIADTGQPSHSPQDDHLRRLSVAYQVASFCLVGLGTLWLTWMSVERQWPLVFLNIAYLVAGIYLWLRIRSGRFRVAAGLVHVFLFFVITEICLLYDIPNRAAPRVTHIYFLAMAFLFYVTFRDIKPRMTYVGVLIYIAGFVLFSSTNFSAPFATPLPDELRIFGAWMHSSIAVAIMCASIYIMQADHATRSRIGGQLAAALAEDQFELHFQPQVNKDGSIRGAEALLRWRHPKRGMVPPGEFIPAAEQLGIMTLIGKWVLDSACAQLAVWRRDPGKSHLRLAINVSPQQFRDENFVSDVTEIVRHHGVDPGSLDLELTESIVVEDIEDVIAKMKILVELGFTLSLDDFGTGYSSLRYLKRMPVSQVKIDQTFVRDMLSDERDAVIVKGIIQLGHELNLSVIAEGVETEKQREFLTEMGCTDFQGYLFSRPLPAPDFARLMETRPVLP